MSIVIAVSAFVALLSFVVACVLLLFKIIPFWLFCVFGVIGFAGGVTLDVLGFGPVD